MEDDIDKNFVCVIFSGEVSEISHEEELEEWLVDSGASLHITYTKNNLTNIEECKVGATVINGQKMMFELKVTVSMKLKLGQTVKLNDVLYVPQSVKNLLNVSRLVVIGATMGATIDKKNIR